MLGFIFASYLAVLAPQLQATTQSLQFEVQFLEWKRPVESSSICIFTKVPDDANVFGCMTVSASVGKPFHAQARFGSEALELSGFVRAIKGNDVEYELEVEHSKDVPLLDADPTIQIGKDMWRIHTSCQQRLGDLFGLRRFVVKVTRELPAPETGAGSVSNSGPNQCAPSQASSTRRDTEPVKPQRIK